MKTNIYLSIICLLTIISQGCIKELHELPPRPDITVKLNGVTRDTIIILPGEEIDVEVECKAQKGLLQEVVIKDKAGANLPGFPLTADSTELRNTSGYSFRFKANDYMADGGQKYQSYTFQVICQDNNSPKQLLSKTITILVADELNCYTVTLGAQDNKEHGGFLNIASGKVYTLEQVRQMNMEELLQIDLCYFWGEEGIVASTEANQRFYPLVGNNYYTSSWYKFLTREGYAEHFKSYSIPLVEQIPVGDDDKMSIQFPYLLTSTSKLPFENYRLTSDLTKYGQSTATNTTSPVVYGIYVLTTVVYANWPEDKSTRLYKPSVIRVNSLTSGPQGSITLDVKASTKFNY